MSAPEQPTVEQEQLEAGQQPQQDPPDALSPAPNRLCALQLSKRFGRRKVVDQTSIRVERGQIVGLLGPNGAGKTTIFYMLAGAIRPDQGEVFLGLEQITHLPMHRRARKGLGYLAQDRSVFRRLSVEDNLRAVLELWPLSAAERRERLEEALETLGIARIRHLSSDQLSGGESRRVEIARLLVCRPNFLLLDEPFAGVDPIAVLDIQELIDQVRQRGIGILITDHNVRETLGITDHTYIIHEGRVLVQGTPQDLAHNELARRIYLGEHFQL